MIDLHTHSFYSDGTDSPGEIVRLAAEKGLSAVALTDHDTVDGLDEFMAAGAEYPGLETWGGVEFSCRYCQREVHILGFLCNWKEGDFVQFMQMMRESRIERVSLLKKRLESLKYPISDADLDEQFAQIPGGRSSSPGRPHFAAALLKKYPERFRDWDDVFAKLLKRGAPAFVERKLPMITDVLEVIRKAGGVAIWAHPVYRSKNERAFVRRMLKRFVPEGLDGVEAYYSLYGVDESAMLNDFAAEFGLARSGGSDYHGKNSPKIELGSGAGKLRVPDELLESLLLRRREKYGIAG